jgi:hypothetical protein
MCDATQANTLLTNDQGITIEESGGETSGLQKGLHCIGSTLIVSDCTTHNIESSKSSIISPLLSLHQMFWRQYIFMPHHSIFTPSYVQYIEGAPPNSNRAPHTPSCTIV